MAGEATEPGKQSLWERFGPYRDLLAFACVFVLGCFYTPCVGETGLPIFLSGRTQLDIPYKYCFETIADLSVSHSERM